MNKYRVRIYTDVAVEAETEEQAYEKAWQWVENNPLKRPSDFTAIVSPTLRDETPTPANIERAPQKTLEIRSPIRRKESRTEYYYQRLK